MEPNPPTTTMAKPDGDVPAAEWILDLFRREPITTSPWEIVQFFEQNEKNINEEYLDKSLEELAEICPEFEENNKGMIEGLEKCALLAVPLFRKLQLMTILSMIREAASSSQVFPLMPDFPKIPAKNLINHIYPDDSLSSDEKTSAYQQIAKNTTNILEHLVSWRNQVVDFVNGLELFVENYGEEMSEEQKKHVEALVTKTKNTIPQIDGKIGEKKLQSAQEIEEFERFYSVVSKEPKWSCHEPQVARSLIQTVFDDSDHSLRAMIARMADVETTKTNGSEEKSEMAVDKEEEEDQEPKAKKRPAEQLDDSPIRRPRTIVIVPRPDKPINLETLRAKN